MAFEWNSTAVTGWIQLIQSGSNDILYDVSYISKQCLPLSMEAVEASGQQGSQQRSLIIKLSID